MFEILFKYPASIFYKGHFVFLTPWPLWLLALAIVAAAGLLFWHVRRNHGMLSRLRPVAILLLRSGSLGFPAALAARPAGARHRRGRGAALLACAPQSRHAQRAAPGGHLAARSLPGSAGAFSALAPGFEYCHAAPPAERSGRPGGRLTEHVPGRRLRHPRSRRSSGAQRRPAEIAGRPLPGTALQVRQGAGTDSKARAALGRRAGLAHRRYARAGAGGIVLASTGRHGAVERRGRQRRRH